MDELKELVTKLERAYQDRLLSVILYGSGAASGSQRSSREIFRSQCPLRAQADHAARARRKRTDLPLVAGAQTSLAAADERGRSASTPPIASPSNFTI